MITVVKFHREIRAGSSLPLIVTGDDGHLYVLKPGGSGDGVTANIIEWLSFRLAQALQIPVPRPEFLIAPSGLVNDDRDPEVIELLERSVGINFGTRHLEDTSNFLEKNSAAISEDRKNDVFLFDLFLLNIDRTARNSNMVVRGSDLWCVDFSSSIKLRSCIEGRKYRESPFLSEMKRHIFYSDAIDPKGFIKRLGAVTFEKTLEAVNELPEEWIHQIHAAQGLEIRKQIADRIFKMITDRSSLEGRLEWLKRHRAESENEREERLLKNKRAFEQKLCN